MTAETAMEWAGAVGIAGLVAAIAFAANLWIDAIGRLTDEASDLLERFNSAANALLDDNRTPMPIAEFVVRLSQEIAKPNLAEWSIAYRPGRSAAPRNDEFSRAMEELPSELAGEFAASVLTAVFLSAAAGPSWGIVRRRAGVEAELEDLVRQTIEAGNMPARIIRRVVRRPPKHEPPITTKVPLQMQRAVAEYVEMQPFPTPRRREPVAA